MTTEEGNTIKSILNGTTIPTAYKMGYVLNHYREPSFRAIEREYGITRPEIVMLIFLVHREGITANDICEFSGHLKASMSRAAIALEKERADRPEGGYGRSETPAPLFDQGWPAMHARFMPTLEARERAMLACLSAREASQFERLLNKLSDHVPDWASADAL